MKETHGSVEATSFGQLSNILTYGQYSVGSSSRSTFQSIHDNIICLDLKEIDKPLPKKHYSLDDLQDLESILVLITGSEDPHRDEVDIFLKVWHFFSFFLQPCLLTPFMLFSRFSPLSAKLVKH